MNKKGVFFMMWVGLMGLLAACQQPTQPVSPAPVAEVAAVATDAPVVRGDPAQEAAVLVEQYIAEQRQQEAANLEVVRRFYDEFATGKAEVILEVHPETLTMHYAGESDEVPAQLLYEDLAALKAANPDLHAEIHEMTAAGNYVFTELTWSGTQTSEFFGIPATGNPVMHNGIVMRRLQDGLIVESWEMWDDLAFLNSLGLSPSWDELVAGSADLASAPPSEPTSMPTPEITATTDVAVDSTSPIGSYRVQLNANNPLGISSGYYRLSLFEDGRYTINWAPQEQLEGMVGVEGHYIITDNEIMFADESGFAACSEAEGVDGLYSFAFLGSSLKLTPIEDSCEARAYVLSNKSLPREK